MVRACRRAICYKFFRRRTKEGIRRRFRKNNREIQISRLAARYRDRNPTIELVIWYSARNSDFDGMIAGASAAKENCKVAIRRALKLTFQDSILILSGQV
jgi:hypothetical protein